MNSTRVPTSDALLTNFAPTENLGLPGRPRPLASSDVAPDEMGLAGRQSLLLKGSCAPSVGKSCVAPSVKHASEIFLAVPPPPLVSSMTTWLAPCSLARSVRASPRPASAQAVTQIRIDETGQLAG